MNPVTIKVRVASRQAGYIRSALKKSVDVDKVVNDWLDANAVSMFKVSNQDSRSWTRINVRLDSQYMFAALRRLYAVGFVLGQDMALYEIAKQMVKKAIDDKDYARARKIDWANWKPGNRAAAQMVEPSGSLQRLLDKRFARIAEMNQTTLDRIGTILGRGLTQGDTRDEIAKNLKSSINELLNDPSRAVMIAQTEMSRAVVESNLETYNELGVEYLEYLVADPCDLCSENLAASPIPANGSWPNGNPPVHPNCMCDVAPYIVSQHTNENIPQQQSTPPDNLPEIQEQVDEIVNYYTGPGVSKPSDPVLLEQYAAAYAVKPPKSAEDVFQNMRRTAELDPEFRYKTNKYMDLADQGLTPYINDLYADYNNYLRNPSQYLRDLKQILAGNDNRIQRYTSDTIQRIKKLDTLLNAAPPLKEPMITYRGIKNNPQLMDELLSAKIGDVIIDKGYTSTDFLYSGAVGWTEGGREKGLIFEIVNPKGTRGINILAFNGETYSATSLEDFFTEREWLLPRNSKFRIIGVNKDKRIVKVVVEQ